MDRRIIFIMAWGLGAEVSGNGIGFVSHIEGAQGGGRQGDGGRRVRARWCEAFVIDLLDSMMTWVEARFGWKGARRVDSKGNRGLKRLSLKKLHAQGHRRGSCHSTSALKTASAPSL